MVDSTKKNKYKLHYFMNMLLFLEIFSLVHMEIGNKLASAQGPEEPELIPDHEDHEKEMKI